MPKPSLSQQIELIHGSVVRDYLHEKMVAAMKQGNGGESFPDMLDEMMPQPNPSGADRRKAPEADPAEFEALLAVAMVTEPRIAEVLSEPQAGNSQHVSGMQGGHGGSHDRNRRHR